MTLARPHSPFGESLRSSDGCEVAMMTLGCSSRYCNPYTTTWLEKVGRYTCPLAIVGAANFA
jgi:hypothetical protein